ncbi:MAG: hypothetical protein RLZZ238_1651, partial [Planctomycetota bacterium]
CDLPDSDIEDDGRIDCVDIELDLVALAPTITEGEPYRVRVTARTIAPILAMNGMQLAVHFDATRLSLDAIEPIENGPFGLPIAAMVDNNLGTLKYALGVTPKDTGLVDSAAIVDLVFSVKPGADTCAQSIQLARLEQVGTYRNLFVTFGNVGVTPELFSLPVADLDIEAPILTGVPASVAIPADAGSDFGAFVAEPTVTTTDNCTDGLVADLTVTYPDASTATAWPIDGMFPVGTTSLEWRVADDTGNETVAQRTVTVHDYQLLDVDITFTSVLKGESTRAIRITAGTHAQVVDVVMPAWIGATPSVGTIEGVQVPVAAGYACISAKDVVHSVSSIDAPTIVGTRYHAAYTLYQGDSNDDDKVDIADFSIYVSDIGAADGANDDERRAARSNFNADLVVDNADFTSISINFFMRGEACGALTGGEPLARISVKDLRRQGLGHLAVADLNADGWVDLADIQVYMQGGRAPGASDAPKGPSELPSGRQSESSTSSGW